MKARILEARSYFSGGLNAVAMPDALATNELLQCLNARVEEGSKITRRQASRVVNDTGTGQPVRGMHYWEPGGVGQLVAISNGSLFYGTIDGALTEEVPPTDAFDATALTDFATFRDAVLNLYMASNGHVFRWSGAPSLAQIDGTNGVPDATSLRSLGARLFMNSLTYPKSLFWSKLGDGSDFTTGGLSGGGSNLVDKLTGDRLLALETVRDSLLCMTKDAIARFTGTADDIAILDDTEGVSADVGINNLGASAKVEQVAMLWTPQGPYVATEGGATSNGTKLVPWRSDDGFAPKLREDTFVAHYQHRHEVWYAYRSEGVASDASVVLVYNYRMQLWMGPFSYPFRITCLATGYDSDGVEHILAGCSDGTIRTLDNNLGGRYDDDDAVGGVFLPSIVPAPFLFPTVGPHITKTLRHVFVEGMRGTATPDVRVDNNTADPAAQATFVSADGTTTGPTSLRYDTNAQGKRFTVSVSWTPNATDEATVPALTGLIVVGANMGRW